MTQYRRNLVPGGTYFFTVNLQDRTSTLLTDQIHLLRNAVAKVRTQSPFHTDAWVTLPNHLHCIWTLPEGDHDFSSRWRDIKKDFSKHLPQGNPDPAAAPPKANAASGNAASGNTQSATTKTTQPTSTTSTTTRSDTA